MNRILLLLLGLCLCSARLSAQVFTSFPDRMWLDSLHAPFVYGLSSGDPLPEAVIIWTVVQTPPGAASPVVEWQVATDSLFQQLVKSGSALADSAHDYTVHVDVTGLVPDTRYWFRFGDGSGRWSDTARTRTAPNQASAQSRVRMAVASCSSIFSGYFNAYRRMGERQDIDFWVHLGDYIYDFVDNEEKVRVPTPFPTSPKSLTEWRMRHRYYLMDPDFRFLLKRHPVVALWDNHDMDKPTDPFGKLAFHEYTPTRMPDSTQVKRIYRSLQWGKLVDLIMIDMYTSRDSTNIPDSLRRILGPDQDAWYRSQLLQSTANWRVIGSEKMIGHWFLNGVPGYSGDNGGWKDYATDRTRMLKFLKDNNINNNLFITGDAHVSMAQDLVPDPNSNYTGSSGVGSYAIEFLPSSINRGNLDEMAGGSTAIANLALTFDKAQNPHHVYQEFIQHGYGIVDITATELTAEFWYSPILQVSQTESMARSLKSLSGENRWFRGSTALDPKQGSSNGLKVLGPMPNPAHLRWQLQLSSSLSRPLGLYLYDAQAKLVRSLWAGNVHAGMPLELDFSTEGLSAGIYNLQISGLDAVLESRRLVLE